MGRIGTGFMGSNFGVSRGGERRGIGSCVGVNGVKSRTYYESGMFDTKIGWSSEVQTTNHYQGFESLNAMKRSPDPGVKQFANALDRNLERLASREYEYRQLTDEGEKKAYRTRLSYQIIGAPEPQPKQPQRARTRTRK